MCWEELICHSWHSSHIEGPQIIIPRQVKWHQYVIWGKINMFDSYPPFHLCLKILGGVLFCSETTGSHKPWRSSLLTHPQLFLWSQPAHRNAISPTLLLCTLNIIEQTFTFPHRTESKKPITGQQCFLFDG